MLWSLLLKCAKRTVVGQTTAHQYTRTRAIAWYAYTHAYRSSDSSSIFALLHLVPWHSVSLLSSAFLIAVSMKIIAHRMSIAFPFPFLPFPLLSSAFLIAIFHDYFHCYFLVQSSSRAFQFPFFQVNHREHIAVNNYSYIFVW